MIILAGDVNKFSWWKCVMLLWVTAHGGDGDTARGDDRSCGDDKVMMVTLLDGVTKTLRNYGG